MITFSACAWSWICQGQKRDEQAAPAPRSLDRARCFQCNARARFAFINEALRHGRLVVCACPPRRGKGAGDVALISLGRAHRMRFS